MDAILPLNAASHRLNASPDLLFGVFAAALISAFHQSVFDMAGLWVASSAHHHGFFAAPAAVWMIAQKKWRPTDPAHSGAGIMITLAGAALWLAGRAASAALLEHLSIVTMLIGGAGAIYGREALRRWALPLGFLYFMVPFGEIATPLLQDLTAVLVVGLMHLVSMPAVLEGALIHTPSGAYNIAEACAGLRFLLAGMMLAAIFAHVSIPDVRQRLLFFGLAIVFAIAANAFRAFALIIIATLSNQQWAVGPDHLLFGWAVYALFFGALIAVGRRFSAPIEEGAPHHITKRARKNILTLAPLVLIMAGANVYSWRIIERPVADAAPQQLSLLNAPGWRLLPPAENWRGQFSDVDKQSHATYQQAQQQVYASFSFVTHQRGAMEIANHKNRAWDNDTWRQVGAERVNFRLFNGERASSVFLLAGPERRRLAALTFYWLGDRVYAQAWRMKAAQMRARLRGRNPSGGMIILAASYRHHPDDAIATLRAFSNDMEPLSYWRARQSGR